MSAKMKIEFLYSCKIVFQHYAVILRRISEELFFTDLGSPVQVKRFRASKVEGREN